MNDVDENDKLRAGILPASPDPEEQRVKWRGIDAIMSVSDRHPWICKSLQIGPGRPCCFAGMPWTGKTMLAQSLAIAVAVGIDAFGFFKVRPGRVRHVDYEQGLGTDLRYKRMINGMGVDPSNLRGRLEIASSPDLFLECPDHYQAWVQACYGWDLCIIDSLRGTFPSFDENDSQIQRFLMVMSKISEETNCSFLVLHHLKKGNGDTTQGIDSLRGSSGIAASLGSIWILEADKEEPVRTMKQVKTHPAAVGRAHEDFGVEIEDVSNNGNTHWGLHLGYRKAETPKTEYEKLKESIVLYLQENTRGAPDRLIAESLGSKPMKTKLALKDLAGAGKIRFDAHDKLYWIDDYEEDSECPI